MEITDSYIEVIQDIANDIGYESGAQAEIIRPLLARMYELVKVWDLPTPYITDELEEKLVELGLEDALDRIYE